MTSEPTPSAIIASMAPVRAKASSYPKPLLDLLAPRFAGRRRQPLGEVFGLQNFGVNLTRLEPAASSSLRHAHARQDEFVYILEGHPTLITNEGRTRLSPGMCAGFKAGTGNAHTLLNETAETVAYLEIGDRTAGDETQYPDDDLHARFDGSQWSFSHKDGTPY